MKPDTMKKLLAALADLADEVKTNRMLIRAQTELLIWCMNELHKVGARGYPEEALEEIRGRYENPKQEEEK